MHLADGKVDVSDQCFLQQLRQFYGLDLFINQKLPSTLAMTRTSNKVELSDRENKQSFILKERPQYLTDNNAEYSAWLSAQVDLHGGLLVSTRTGLNGRLHFHQSDQRYILLDKVDGIHPWDAKEYGDIVSRDLALFHNRMATISEPDNSSGSLFMELKQFGRSALNCGVSAALVKRLFDLILQLEGLDLRTHTIHGDISPSNVIVTKSQQCVFIDFDNMATGSAYYDIASFCQTFLQLVYQNNSSHLHHTQNPALNMSATISLIRGYIRYSNSISTPEAFNCDVFCQFYELVWLEHMILGAMRKDFHHQNATDWADDFEQNKQVLLERLNNELCRCVN
ncbi:aminoglycoside phosphotransferase family protein [Vibrio sp. SCSIO 43132]|uniref:aminoglycoside phosphotransferase family protein n=1 Tax=Vibrio sp. SCSIO 43132 TaxID=2779363 RepID=UPI001CAA3A4C|nr:aminoglycoside phosphotransferase family protein [Vibrio sp. SCSIO 43132]UAB73916.1 aminoglycoside phosphotransferase family protein [Vibrio sp. SCSIO 43132]